MQYSRFLHKPVFCLSHFSIRFSLINVDFSIYVLYTHECSSDVTINKPLVVSPPIIWSKPNPGALFCKNKGAAHLTKLLPDSNNLTMLLTLYVWSLESFPLLTGFYSLLVPQENTAPLWHWQLKVCTYYYIHNCYKNNRKGQQSLLTFLSNNAQLFRLYPRSFSDILIV